MTVSATVRMGTENKLAAQGVFCHNMSTSVDFVDWVTCYVHQTFLSDRALFSVPPSQWKKPRGVQQMTW